jgi:hypothetical protein
MVSNMADCVLGVARLISSARQICVKIGPRWNSHQVGRELDARKLQVQRLGQRADQQRLAQAGHALQQAVPADEQTGQDAVDDVVVPDDDSADLLAHRAVALDELLGPLLHGFADSHDGVVSPRGVASRINQGHERFQFA